MDPSYKQHCWNSTSRLLGSIAAKAAKKPMNCCKMHSNMQPTYKQPCWNSTSRLPSSIAAKKPVKKRKGNKLSVNGNAASTRILCL